MSEDTQYIMKKLIELIETHSRILKLIDNLLVRVEKLEKGG